MMVRHSISFPRPHIITQFRRTPSQRVNFLNRINSVRVDIYSACQSYWILREESPDLTVIESKCVVMKSSFVIKVLVLETKILLDLING